MPEYKPLFFDNDPWAFEPACPVDRCFCQGPCYLKDNFSIVMCGLLSQYARWVFVFAKALLLKRQLFDRGVRLA